MSRIIFVIFGVLAYLLFFTTFLYLVGFVAGLPALPHSIDHGPEAPAAAAAFIDLTLIAVFGLQHSIMARPGFKAAWTRAVPRAIERSTYVVFACAALILMFALWHPLPDVIWQVDSPLGTGLLWALFGLGWLIVLTSSYLINHFELFGLAQVWRNLRGRSVPDGPFRTPLFYAFVRHPLYSGFLIAFWATPVMTVGHLLFSAGMTAYILIAIGYEERDLIAHFGQEYVVYRRNVGKLVPRLGRRG